MSARATSCACRSPTAPIDDAGWPRSFETLPRGPSRASTAITSPSPIEIVNLRAGRRRPDAAKIAKPAAGTATSLDAARVRKGTVHVPRRRQARRLSDTDFYRRDLLPVGERIAGPAIILQMDSHHRRAAAATTRGRRGGQSDHRGGTHEHRPSPPTRRQARPHRPVTASVIQGALENIAVEMGYKLMRMSYSSIIRESEDFGAALVDAEGRAALRDRRRSTPLQSGPIPGYVRGILQTAGGARRHVPAGRRDHAQRRLCRRQPRPRRRLLRAGVRRRAS